MISIDYRLAPANRWPAQIDDVRAAIAWARAHAADYGGDGEFICATGGSAGGTLVALAGLTEFESETAQGGRTRPVLRAVVPYYASYELLANHGLEHLEKFVMPRSSRADPELWRQASPARRITPDAPPFFVVHGTLDGLAEVEDARAFVARLRQVSRADVLYAELAGAHHGFDAQYSIRVDAVVDAAARFLDDVYRRAALQTASASASTCCSR